MLAPDKGDSNFFLPRQYIISVCYNFATFLKLRGWRVSFLEQFEIRFATLKPGLHDFRFEISDSFFKEFEDSFIGHGKGECLVQLDKKTNLLTFDFDIKISVELVCDRSLEKFQYPIELKEQLIVKFDEEESELGEDILTISWNSQGINIAQTIYEYISVSIPMKKIHPNYLRENENEFGEIIYKSESDASEDTIDPRWNDLKNLN